jgi:hypothetical protein
MIKRCEALMKGNELCYRTEEGMRDKEFESSRNPHLSHCSTISWLGSG